MARLFITGSTDGLGLMAGRRLADEGHAAGGYFFRQRPREHWTAVVVTDHGHLDEGGHGGREPEVTTAWAAAAGPGIEPGGPPLITRQAQVAPLVLAAAGWPASQG